MPFAPFVSFLFPLHCEFCGKKINEIEDPAGVVCPDCAHTLEQRLDYELCRTCGMHLPCVCEQPTRAFYETRALYVFKGGARELVHALKFGRRKAVADFFAQRLVARFERYIAMHDMLVPAPLGKKRLRERGFNQSERIAEGIAKQLAIPVAKTIVIRAKETRPLSDSHDADERRRIIENAFRMHEAAGARILGKRILLVDDVITTGVTLHELAKTLSAFGAKSVNALAVARA